MKQIPPETFNLHRTVKLFRKDHNTIVIQKNRKSRIIMKDGKKIVKITNQINKTEPYTNILFETNAPMCSKTKVFLIDHGIKTKETG